MKKAFTLIEIIIFFSLILLVSFLSIPLILNDSRQATEISTWRHTYKDIIYTFKSLNIQNDEQPNAILVDKLKSVNDPKGKEKILIDEFTPYLRINSELKDNKYKIRYLNSEKIGTPQFYYFDNFYITQCGSIIGIKWIGELFENSPIIMLLFDVNGVERPNKWGKDVFGINIYKNRIEPFGKNIPVEEVDADCSKKGRGVYCSYKYLTGAQF